MLTEPKTIEIGKFGESGDGIFFDVDPASDWIQVRVGTQKAGIRKNELWGLAFAIADAKTQDDLMPIRQTEIMVYERIHKVRAKTNINKGDVLSFKCKVDVPVTIKEGLKGIINEKKYIKT